MRTLVELLGEKKAILLDGATGTNLFEMGLQSGDAPEFWNLERPADIERLHQNFIDSGSDAILTNSFGGNARRLMLHRAEDQVSALNQAAAEIARKCADNSARDILVFGSIGPTGDLFAPLGELTQEAAEQCFADQATALDKGGVDAFWIETLSSIEEAEAAIAGIRRVSDKMIFLAMSFDTAGRTMMGITPASLPDLLGEARHHVAAMGANCGIGPAEMLESLCAMRAAHPDIPLIAKSNYGVPEFKDGSFHYHGTPEMMAQYAQNCLDLGVTVIGGCCGTAPNTIRAMRDAIDSHIAPSDDTDPLEKTRLFISQNRAQAEVISRESTEPTDQQGSDRRSAGRSRKNRR